MNGADGRATPAVYFLSDYGTADEFVGVVHAVLHRWAPGVRVVDLSHGVPPFDTAAGAAMLERSAPSLGPGVVLAVVDPGVGTHRRAVAVRTASDAGPARPGPTWWVGPDNGLLTSAVSAAGGAEEVIVLGGPGSGPLPQPPGRAAGRTFDGRDVFAPATAYLLLGGDPALLGTSADPGSLVAGAIPSGTADRVEDTDDGPVLESAVTWVDRFGNVQLGSSPSRLDALGLPLSDAVPVTVWPAVGGHAGTGLTVTARRVEAFGHLAAGEWGMVTDAAGRVAIVLDRASAAEGLGGCPVGTRVRIGPVTGHHP